MLATTGDGRVQRALLRAGAGLLWLLVAAAATAHAQANPAANADDSALALFPTATGDAGMRTLAGALDPVLLAKLSEVAGVEVAARPALDLPSLQLAIDCLGETPECLRAVAQQSNVQRLIAPSIQVAGQETVVTLLYFDAAGQGELRSVTRRFHAADVQHAALDAVPDMLRELFQIPTTAEATPEQAPATPPQAATTAPAESTATERAGRPFPLAPAIVTGAGVVLIGVSAAFGVASQSARDEYAAAPANTKDEVDSALQTLQSAQDRALIADVGYAVGGATLIAAGVLWAFWLSSDGTAGDSNERGPQTALSLSPLVGAESLGLFLRGPCAL